MKQRLDRGISPAVPHAPMPQNVSNSNPSHNSVAHSDPDFEMIRQIPSLAGSLRGVSRYTYHVQGSSERMTGTVRGRG